MIRHILVLGLVFFTACGGVPSTSFGSSDDDGSGGSPEEQNDGGGGSDSASKSSSEVSSSSSSTNVSVSSADSSSSSSASSTGGCEEPVCNPGECGIKTNKCGVVGCGECNPDSDNPVCGGGTVDSGGNVSAGHDNICGGNCIRVAIEFFETQCRMTNPERMVYWKCGVEQEVYPENCDPYWGVQSDGLGYCCGPEVSF